MEDEIKHGNVTHVSNKGSPESPHVTCCDSNNNNNNNNKEQDRFLPIANVSRILKKVIPSNGKISKDAKETIQECVSEFISFVTGEASDKCQREKRKTINGDDIIWAITTLGFEEYVGPLKLYLSKYREMEGEKLIFPKQQRSDQRRQHSEYEQNIVFNNNNNININTNSNNNVYSSINVYPSFVPSDQPFSCLSPPIPFKSNYSSQI